MNYQPTLLVPGTWAAGKEDPYWGTNGSFVRYLEILNWIVLARGESFWTTNLEGGIFERLFGSKAGWHRDWTSGGRHLLLELKSLPPEILAELIIICHSHGLQVVLYALAAAGCPSIKGLISVGSPDRADMQDVQAIARTKIAGRWLHLQMGDADNWSWLDIMYHSY